MDLHQFLGRPPGGAFLPGQEFLVKRLVAKLANSKNVAFAAHDGWGKTILRKEVEYVLLEQNEDIRTFHLEVYEKENPSSFIIRYVNELCKRTSTKPPSHQPTDYPDFKLLENPACPLQGFGSLYCLQRNQVASFTSYIRSLFLQGDKMIDATAANSIASKTDNHLFYLHLLSWHAFAKTDRICTVSIVDEAFKNLAYHFEPHMKDQVNRLTLNQLNYLRALLNNTEKICSRESIKHYKLGNSSNIARVRHSLTQKGIVEVHTGFVMIVNPLFSHWLKKTFLNWQTTGHDI